jgi:putative endonuclease
VVQPGTRTLGARAERLALRFLKRRGLKPVTTNFSCRLGEIDIIMTDGHCLVIAEVRYRGHGRRVPAALSVDARKRHKLVRSAAVFVSGQPRFRDLGIRFDVVAVEVDAAGEERIEWIRDAFRPGDNDLRQGF